MLVLSRQRDETITIGDDSTAHVVITPIEEQKLRQCVDPGLLDLAERLLASRGPIEVTVVDIRGDKVRAGITAPKDVPVHRKEVHEAIKRENRQPAEVSGRTR